MKKNLSKLEPVNIKNHRSKAYTNICNYIFTYLENLKKLEKMIKNRMDKVLRIHGRVKIQGNINRNPA